MHRFKTLIVFFATIFAVWHFASAAKPMLCLELASYQQLTADVGALGNHVQNPMLNMALMTFGNIIGSPGMLGIDQEKPLRWALFSEGDSWHKHEWVAMLPITEEGKAFLENLSVSYDMIQDDGVIRRFRANRHVQSFREMSLRLLKEYAVVSPSEPLLKKALAMLETDADVFTPRGIAGTLRVILDGELFLSILRQTHQENLHAATAVGEPPVGLAGLTESFGQIYSDFAFGELEQAEQIGWGVECNDSGLTFYSRTDALEGTIMAEACADARPVPANMLHLLQEDACLIFASGTLQASIKQGTEQMKPFFEKIMAEAEKVPELADIVKRLPDMTEMLENSANSWQMFGDGLVVSIGKPLTGEGRMVFFEAMSLKDGNKALEMMDEHTGFMNGYCEALGLPLKVVRRDDRQVGETTVRTYGFEISKLEEVAQEEGVLNQIQKSWLEMQGEIGKRMDWFASHVVELAVVDNCLLITAGRVGSLDGFLAKAQNPSEESWSNRSKVLFPEIRNHDQASEFWLCKPFEMLRLLEPMLNFEERADVKDIFSNLPADEQGMGGLGMFAPRTAMRAVRLSPACLTGLARSVAMAQKLNPMRGGQGRPAEEPVGEPVDVILPEE